MLALISIKFSVIVYELPVVSAGLSILVMLTVVFVSHFV